VDETEAQVCQAGWGIYGGVSPTGKGAMSTTQKQQEELWVLYYRRGGKRAQKRHQRNREKRRRESLDDRTKWQLKDNKDNPEIKRFTKCYQSKKKSPQPCGDGTPGGGLAKKTEKHQVTAGR